MMNMKCDNCGATLEYNEEQRLKFCPFCGFALPVPEDAASMEKYRLEHEEKVRQQKVEEERENKKRAAKQKNRELLCILALLALCLLGIILNGALRK